MQAVRSRLFWYVVAALVAAALVALAARLAVRAYDDDAALRSLAGWSVPGDLGIFLQAGDDVLAGRNPYPSPDAPLGGPSSSEPYVYPPVFALAITPLAAIRVTVAAMLFNVFLLACVVGALLLLGVRDWRCHAIAILNTFTRQAIEYGAVGPLLLLFVALCWRYRDRAWIAAAAAAAATVLKLFLWPLVLWLAVTSRMRAAVLTVAVAIGATLLSWAAIGFDGLTDYPGLLRDLVELEAENSYSAVATVYALGVPTGVAQTFAIVAGGLLLLLAAGAAREDGVAALQRDELSFILVLAAALVLTPILWVHYLVLLFVPIALAQPRFSVLWLAPLAAWPFWILGAYAGWANGELDDVLSIAAIVVIVFAGAVGLGRARLGREAPSGQAA